MPLRLASSQRLDKMPRCISEVESTALLIADLPFSLYSWGTRLDNACLTTSAQTKNGAWWGLRYCFFFGQGINKGQQKTVHSSYRRPASQRCGGQHHLQRALRMRRWEFKALSCLVKLLLGGPGRGLGGVTAVLPCSSFRDIVASFERCCQAVRVCGTQ